MQHADDGYPRRGNFGYSLLHSMFLMYSPDGTNVYGSRGGEVESQRVTVGAESYKIVFLGEGALPIQLFKHFCPRMYRSATIHVHFLTDRRTDDSIMPRELGIGVFFSPQRTEVWGSSPSVHGPGRSSGGKSVFVNNLVAKTLLIAAF